MRHEGKARRARRLGTCVGLALLVHAGAVLAHADGPQPVKSKLSKGFYKLPLRPGHYLAMATCGHQWGKEPVIRLLMNVSEEWGRRYPDRPFSLGDISAENGAKIGHHSHMEGIDFDVYLFRNDGKGVIVTHGGRTVELVGPDGKKAGRAKPTTYTAGKDQINIVITNDRELIQAIRPKGVTVGDDAMLNAQNPVRVHDDHFHIRINVGASPAQASAPKKPAAPPKAPPPKPAPASAQGWTVVGKPSTYGAVGYRAIKASGNNVLLAFGGWSAKDAYVRTWAQAVLEAKLKPLGMRHLYAVPGPADVTYRSREVATAALVAHLAGVASDESQLIVVLSHSSGVQVAGELLELLYAQKPALLSRVVFYKLDGGAILRPKTQNALAKVFCVYATANGKPVSRNWGSMTACGTEPNAKTLAVSVDATASGCKAANCFHDTVIISKPYNPQTFDLKQDYQQFDAEHRVTVDYLTKTWSTLEELR